MKATCAILLTSLGALISGSSLSAAPITYDSWYTADALPTASGGTIQDPSFQYSSIGTVSATAADGLLSASTMPGAANQQFWRVGSYTTGGNTTNYGTQNAWSMDNATGGTVDLTLQVTGSTTATPATGPQGGFTIFVGNNSHYAVLFFNTTGISFSGAATAANTTHVNTMLQTYRIVFQDGKLSLYEAGNNTALFANLAMTATLGLNYMYWGDGASAVSGSYNLGFIGWDNTANFSAPPVNPVPEPSTILLGLLGGMGMIVWRRKGRHSSTVL
jgi:hypothetical protein